MPTKQPIRSVLVIGSGPIIIGQAAEFDYAGTQACIALKEEGYRVILVNNNPATIMTDSSYADTCYFEPLTVKTLEKIIKKEQPDGILATFGGQTGLNLAVSLHEKGILQQHGVKLLGTDVDAIKKGENRETFRSLMLQLNEPVPDSVIVHEVGEAIRFAEQIGYPIIVRPAYTLGGSGGGIAAKKDSLTELVTSGLAASPVKQCLVEKSIAGWKEIEFEIIRDGAGQCISICDMENIDPVGIHTGDSIVVAPSQTLTTDELTMLRAASFHIVNALGIIGSCNIQFALNSETNEYYVIEVNPRVSRSSALASKATGYPIARVAAKLALGYTLKELPNPVTETGTAEIEPKPDYAVIKFPVWPFDKFPEANRNLGTQMKATGEVMAIGDHFENALQKAVRSLHPAKLGLSDPTCSEMTIDQLWDLVSHPDDRRFFAMLELLRRGISSESLAAETSISHFFVHKFHRLIELEQKASDTAYKQVTADFYLELKIAGFSDEWLSHIWGITPHTLREFRKQHGIYPRFQMVDSCNTNESEHVINIPYYFSSWIRKHEVHHSNAKKMAVIGSGPIRIGQGIEFDYCSVHGVFALKQAGYEAIMINNNPETVSTDFQTADRLYFEPLTTEDILNVLESEQIDQCIVQFGGQTAINLAKELEDAGIHLLGTSQDTIDQLEDRDRFYQLLNELNIPHIPGEIAQNQLELIEKAKKMGYPVLLRPSYVIGGKGMIILDSEEDLEAYHKSKTIHYPVLIDSFLPGKEVEVDILSDGKDIHLPVIIEHLEKAGVHSGDSFAMIPAQTINDKQKEKIETYASTIAKAIHYQGIMNIQYVIHENNVYVLEVNPRASRTVPIVSKVTGIPLIQIATKLLLGKYLSEFLGEIKKNVEKDHPIAVKFPVFSTEKLMGVDPLTGPEMKSTGEGISIAASLAEAFHKAFHWKQKHQSTRNTMLINPFGLTLAYLEQVKKQLHHTNLVVVNDRDFRQWLTSKDALAYVTFFDRSTEDQWRRREVINQGLLLFTQPETFEAFIISQQVEDYSVHSIESWLQNQPATL